MGAEMIVVAILFLQGFVDGEPKNVEIASQFHRMTFDSLESCQETERQIAGALETHLESSLREFWTRPLNADDDELIVETRSLCRNAR